MKCKHCGKELTKEEAYNPSPRNYYCNKFCFDERERKRLGEGKTKKIKYKPKDDGNPRRIFTDKVQSIYINYGWDKNKINWQMICGNALNILKEHENWSYDTLTYILYYMHDILGLNLISEESNYSPLSLLPYYAIEAEEYYNQTESIKESIENFDFNEEIKIIKNIQHKKIKHKLINMEDI